MEKKEPNVHVALLHWPVWDRAGNVVCTNVTNFDIHDIARASRVYGVKRYFIVNRMQEQLMFVSRVLEHWRIGNGSKYNPKRKTALNMIELAETLEDVLKSENWAERPLVIATSAKPREGVRNYSFREIKEAAAKADREILLVFGTGFGLDNQVIRQCDGVLEAIKGASKDDYRHLSVRSAVSICLDRVLGAW